LKKSFDVFVHLKKRTGAGLASEILNKLEDDGITLRIVEHKGMIMVQIWPVNIIAYKL